MTFIKYQLYLLQIENYEVGRFLRLLFKKGYFRPNSPLRKSLHWTKKITLVTLLSFVLIVLSAYMTAVGFGTLPAILCFVFSILIYPIYLAIVVYLLLPIDLAAKRYIIARASAKLRDKNDIKIVGIAGSYGKTTMKNVLSTVLSEKLVVLAPTGNINTAVGLSSWILKQNISGANILLIEFGEEYPGDNRRINNIFRPDISIITGINEAHYERMGSIEQAAATIFEAVENPEREVTVFINSADENVIKYHKQYTAGKKVIKYDINGCGGINITDMDFDQNRLRWHAIISGIGEMELSFLAEYIFADIAVATRIALDMGLTSEQISSGLSKILPVGHRLQPIVNERSGVLVIDDSYNGNPSGVEEAIKTLSRFTERRKIYLTPGLVETGSRNREVHEKIGEQLSGVADKVILINNSATPHIAEGLLSAGFSKDDIIWYKTAPEAHAALGGILKSGDVILFQNDWGDQYL